MNKASPELDERLASTVPDELLDVVLELHPPVAPATSSGLARSEQLASHKESFLALARPVEQLIAQLGGSVLGEVWLNHTLRARIPSGSLSRLAEQTEVARLDIPRQLFREGSERPS